MLQFTEEGKAKRLYGLRVWTIVESCYKSGKIYSIENSFFYSSHRLKLAIDSIAKKSYINTLDEIWSNRTLVIPQQASYWGFEKGGSSVHNQPGISGITSENATVKKISKMGFVPSEDGYTQYMWFNNLHPHLRPSPLKPVLQTHT